MEEQLADYEPRRTNRRLRASSGGFLRKLMGLIWAEWLARKGWLAIAGLVGALPVLAVLLLLRLNPEYRGLHIVAAFIAGFTGISSGLAALGVGLSLNWRELTEQRRGFLLAKPLSGHLLWTGKFLAGVGLIIVVILITALPGTLLVTRVVSWDGPSAVNESHASNDSPVVHPVDSKEAIENLGLAPIFALIAVPVFPLAFWGGIALGTRTRWLGLDFLLVLLYSIVGLFSLSQLTSLDFENAAQTALFTVLFTFWVALIAAGGVSVARGGTSHRRLHQLLSLSFWTPATLAVAGLFAYASWYVRPHFRDLRDPEVVSAAPSGSWFEIEGQVRGRDGEAQYLFDSGTGETAYVGWSQSVDGRVSYSADGKTAGWIEDGPPRRPLEQPVLHIAQLQGPRLKLLQLPLSSDRRLYFEREVYLSPEGEFVIILSGYGYFNNYGNQELGPQVAYRIRDGALEHALDLSKHFQGRCGVPTFIDRSTIRCYPLSPTNRNQIVEIDLLETTSEVVGSLPDYMLSREREYRSSGWFSVSLSAERIAETFWDSDRELYEIAFIDARSGEEIRRVAIGWSRVGTGWSSLDIPLLSWLQSDDRLVGYGVKSRQVQVFSGDGELLRSIDLPLEPISGFVQANANTLLFAGQQEPSYIAAVSSFGSSQRGPELYRIELSTGVVRALRQNLIPVLVWHSEFEENSIVSWWRWRSAGFHFQAKGPASKIFYGAEGNLEVFDFESGDRRSLLDAAG